jgi:hypothetical protein
LEFVSNLGETSIKKNMQEVVLLSNPAFPYAEPNSIDSNNKFLIPISSIFLKCILIIITLGMQISF